MSEPLWSNASAVYLGLDELGGLVVGAPDAETIELEPSGVVRVGWSPHHNRAWYTGSGSGDARRGDPFVLDLGQGSHRDAVVTSVARDVLDARWSSGGEQLVYTTENAGTVGLHVWSRSEQFVSALAEYPGQASVGFELGPEGRHVLVRPENASSEDPLTQYRVVSLAGGAERLRVAAPSSDSVRWVWPEPWVQHRPFEGETTLFDLADPEVIVPTVLGAPLEALSPQRGTAVQAGRSDAKRLVTGLPSSVAAVRDLPSISSSSFSPDGRFWAAIDPWIDEQGRRKEHGGLLQIAEATYDGATWLVTDLAGRVPSADGIRWLDAESFVLVLWDHYAEEASLTLIEKRDGSWRMTEIGLADESPDLRMFVLGSDPCQVLTRSRERAGCAAPWR